MFVNFHKWVRPIYKTVIDSMLVVPALLPDTISGPALFAGDDACLTLGLLAGLRAVRPGQPLLIVDGANAFDPFLVADLARKSGLVPGALLNEIRISRVFTCHQLEALLRGRLTVAVRQFHSQAVYFSGLLDPLLDEEVPYGEAVRIFRLIPPALQHLAASGVVPLCACPPPLSIPGREKFFAALCETAAWVFQVSRQGHPELGRGMVHAMEAQSRDAVQITCTKPMAATWTWEPQIGMVVPRRWW